jgi:RNA polymerase sigma-70 factor (ECF subfamily)
MGLSITTSSPERPALTVCGGDPASDEALMRRIANPKASRGEIETGMEALVARQAKEVWRYFVRRGANPHTADDLTQEVFLRVLRERSRFDTAQAFAPWLYTIAHHLWISEGRRRQAEAKALGGLASTTRPDGEASKTPVLQEELLRLRSALASLSEGDRELLNLTRFEGLTYEKAAGIVGCSAGAAKVRAFRALEKLRKWMLEGGDS